jgi:hypothetical protein
MHEVERRGLKPTREEVVFDKSDVREAFAGSESLCGGEHCIVDIRSDDLATRPDPLAQHSKPPHGPTSHVNDAESATIANFG